MPDRDFFIPFIDKRMNTADKGLFVGRDFVSVKNLAPGNGLIPHKGMTKINSSNVLPTANQHPQSMFHFKKDTPYAESHVLVQTKNASDAVPVIIQNEGVIPAATDFTGGATPTALYTEDTAAGTARFSDAPGGQLMICDGKETLIWGGDEMPVAAVIGSTATITGAQFPTFPTDVTSKMRNSDTDENEVIMWGSNNDSATVLLLNCDGNFTDTATGGTTHTVTSHGGITQNTDIVKFGTESGEADGAGDYLDIADTLSDFDLGTGGVDLWIYPEDISAEQVLYYHGDDANNYCKFYITATGQLGLEVANDAAGAGGTQTIETTVLLVENKWQHVAFMANASDYTLWLHGDRDGNETIAQALQGYLGSVYLFADSAGANEFTGRFDEVRVSKDASGRYGPYDITPQNKAYVAGNTNYLIGSTRPLKGVKFYVQVGGENVRPGSLSAYYWNGSSWVSLTITDGTKPASFSLAQTGSVTFTSTVDNAKKRYIEGRYLYWYNFNLSGSAAQVYQMTVDAPVQKIRDLWDRQLRPIHAFLWYDSDLDVYKDNTVNVAIDGYDTGNDGTFAKIVTYATATDYLYIGSLVRLTGVQINMLDEFINKGVSSGIDTVKYWDGSAWVALTDFVDGTLLNNVSLASSGTLTWEVPDEAVEHKKSIAGRTPLYYYQIHLDVDTTADVRIYYIGGIPAEEKIGAWSFSMEADNCLWLGDEIHDERNALLRSMPGAPDVLSGSESFRIKFGDEKKLIASTAISLKEEDQLTDIKLVLKHSQAYALRGGPAQDSYRVKLISKTKGCVAPDTLKTGLVDLGGESVECAIWKGPEGIYIWYGSKPKPVHWDIRNLFDPTKANHLRFHPDYIDRSVGVVNEKTRRYHLKYADGNSSGELNRETAMDMKNPGSWHEVYRSDVLPFDTGTTEIKIGDTLTCNSQTAEVLWITVTSGTWAAGSAAGDIYLIKKTGAFAAGNIQVSAVTYAQATADSSNLNLQCAATVEDVTGNRYNYGIADNGYMYRMDFGTSMDGKYIVFQYRTGNIAIYEDNPLYETIIQELTQFMDAKTTTDQVGVMIHRGDGIQAGKQLTETYSPSKSGYDYVGGGRESRNVHEGNHATHSFEFVGATDDETEGLAPFGIGGFYEVAGKDNTS